MLSLISLFIVLIVLAISLHVCVVCSKCLRLLEMGIVSRGAWKKAVGMDRRGIREMLAGFAKRRWQGIIYHNII